MKNNHLLILGVILVVYFILDTLIPGGGLILYPIKLFVTFIHEFGHAFGNVITGGDVAYLQVNSDGSGVTGTIGGNRAVTIMGGYLGSALFGNILLYLGIRKPKASKITLMVIAGIMLVSSLMWFSTAFNLIFIILFSAALILISLKESICQYVLMFLGGASVLYVISDFNVGPSSDLNAFAEVWGLTQSIWMYIWLGIVLAMTYFNLKSIIRKS